MSRTFRHRHMTPHGVQVVDNPSGGVLVLVDRVPAARHWWTNRSGFALFINSLGRTKESRAARKRHWKSYRARVADSLRHCDVDNIPRIAKTQGWLTH